MPKPSINLQDLLDAFAWVSSGEAVGFDCVAYVNKATGAILYSGEEIDEEIDEKLPDDIGDEEKYLALPDKRDFGLGSFLALRFVAENIPDSYERVQQYFRKKGAYSRFKDELDRAGQLEEWYEYEQRATREALEEWSKEHGFLIECRPGSKDH